MATDTAPTSGPRPRGTGLGTATPDPTTMVTATPDNPTASPDASTPEAAGPRHVIDLRRVEVTGLVDARTMEPVRAPAAEEEAAAAVVRQAARRSVWITLPPPPRPAPPPARWLVALAAGAVAPLTWPLAVAQLPLGEQAQGGLVVGGWTLLAVVASRIAARGHDHDDRDAP